MGKAGLKLLTISVLSGAACLLLVTLAAPRIIQRGVQGFFVQLEGDHLDIGATRFNPFTLSARLDDLWLKGANGSTIFSIDSMQLNFSILSLLQQQILLTEVSLRRPQLSMDISAANSRSPLAGLIGPLSRDEETGDAPGLRIALGSVHGGVLHLYVKGPIHEGQTGGVLAKMPETGRVDLVFSDIECRVKGFHSGSGDPAGLTLSAMVNQSATLRAEGQLVPVNGALDTSLQVTNLDLAGFSTLLGSSSAGARMAGILRAEGWFSHDAANTHFSGELGISRFEAGATPDTQPWFSVVELNASGADISAWPLRLAARYMKLEQPRLELALAKNERAAGKPILSELLFGVFGPRSAYAGGKAVGPLRWLPAINALEVDNGRLSVVDPRLSEPVRIQLNHVTGGVSSHATGGGSARGSTVITQLSGTVGDSSPVTWNSLVQLSSGHSGHGSGPESGGRDASEDDILGAIELQQADATLFSGYLARSTSREILSGTLNLGLGYYLKGGTLAVSSKGSLKDLQLTRSNEKVSGDELPLELALALLTDPTGKLSFELPILGAAGNPAKSIETAIGRFVSAVTASPFDLLASLAGFRGTGLNVVGFEAGSAAISAAAEQQLRALGEALRQRPVLGLRVTGSHARQADRTALARQQIQLHVALAASTRPVGRPEQAMLDFADPKVQVVLDEFASARLSASKLAEIKQHQGANGEGGVNALDAGREGYFRQVFDALVMKEQVGDKALRQLARYRAQSVIRQLEGLGIAAGRLQLAGSIDADDQPVILELFAVPYVLAGE